MNGDPQQFQSKPVLVYAAKWTGANLDAVKWFLTRESSVEDVTSPNIAGGRGLVIHTPQGAWLIVTPNDWIVREPDGFHVYKPDAFNEAYEEAR